ncbi:MAG TPA: hypothetical protein VFA30_07965 [Gaiellaceae bacterium]|nr:hypothetical protein [Gaiellaceae bacterium]
MNAENVLWIGGPQWSGKTTVAMILGARYPLIRYSYDYHDARSHAERARTNAGRFPAFHAFLDASPDAVWVDAKPVQMAKQAHAIFKERFQMVLEDIARLPLQTTVLAEGWGLRPELLATVVDEPTRCVFLLPTEAFRKRQLETLDRSKSLSIQGLRDPDRAQQNRVERDRLLADDVRAQAAMAGLPIIDVDGSETHVEVAARVERQFRPFLPTWLY